MRAFIGLGKQKGRDEPVRGRRDRAAIVACSGGAERPAIRLIDQAHSQGEFAASNGLGEAYQGEVPGELVRSMLDQDTIRDRVVHVSNVEKDPRVWQAEHVRSEGIASMLSAAILGRTGALGVLRAYGAPRLRP